MVEIGKNKYYTLGVIDKSKDKKEYFENIVIGDLASGEPTFYVFRYFFNDNIYKNLGKIDLKSLEGGHMKTLDSFGQLDQKDYSCTYITTSYCDVGGSTHVAGANCTGIYTRTSSYCISTPDYWTYSTFIYSGSGGGTPGPGSSDPAFIDPNDPYTQPITTPEMYAGGLDYHLDLTSSEYNWLLNHTDDAARAMEFLDKENYSLGSKDFAEKMIELYVKINYDGNIKDIISSGITSTAEFIHLYYTEVSAIVEDNPEYLVYANYFIDILRNLAAEVISVHPMSASWVDLTNMWLFELGNNPMNFVNDTYTINKLKNLEGTSEARGMVLNAILTDNLEISHQWNYGQNEFYTGMTEANLATSFLGTYTVDITIKPISFNQYELSFHVTNTSTWESATRLRVDNNLDGAHDGIFPNKARGDGLHLGGNFKQNWYWKETKIIY